MSIKLQWIRYISFVFDRLLSLLEVIPPFKFIFVLALEILEEFYEKTFGSLIHVENVAKLVYGATNVAESWEESQRVENGEKDRGDDENAKLCEKGEDC